MRLGVACPDGAAPAAVLELLGTAGLPVAPLAGARAPLLTVADDTTWLLSSGADVLAACEDGRVDVGVVGKDLLLELEPDVYELLDLGVCRDRLVFATAPGPACRRPRPRVATRYPSVAREYFAATGRQVRTLTLADPVVSPALGLADGVVELESRLTGAAGLTIAGEVAPGSARLVAARAARALQGARLADLVNRLRELVDQA